MKALDWFLDMVMPAVLVIAVVTLFAFAIWFDKPNPPKE